MDSILQATWYQTPRPSLITLLLLFLLPLSFLFGIVTKLRRLAYRFGLLKQVNLSVPVIVVGNLTVGGTGKTPTVIQLAQDLRQRGYRPGIITRGYGTQASEQSVCHVLTHKSPYRTSLSDEAQLIAHKSQCPVAAFHDRVKAGTTLISLYHCNVIISDDGLQHYALGRDIEIAVVDGNRRFGNGYLLPAGPNREPQSRLASVDFVVTKDCPNENEFTLTYTHADARNIKHPELTKPLADFSHLTADICRVVAGIGNPQQFLSMLTKQGLNFTAKIFPDHHRFTEKDILFSNDVAVLMTEKDAVKVAQFATDRHWSVPLSVDLSDDLFAQVLTKLSLIKTQGGYDVR